MVEHRRRLSEANDFIWEVNRQLSEEAKSTQIGVLFCLAYAKGMRRKPLPTERETHELAGRRAKHARLLGLE